MAALSDLAALEALASTDEEVPAQKRARTAAPASSTAARLEVEPISGLRVDLNPRTRRLGRADVEALAASFTVRRLPDVPALMRAGPTKAPTAWLTIGCLVERGPAKPTQRGDSFCVWKMSDLATGGSATTISVFLFGEAFKESWKEMAGSVFALLTPRIVPPKDKGGSGGSGGSSGDAALSVEKAQQLQRIGQALDFGLCKGERRDGKPCGMWVNRSECDHCEYHAAAALRQLQRAQHASTLSKRAASAQGAGASQAGRAATSVPHGVTAVPGLALPSFAAPPNSGVPRGLAPHARPGWSAANMAPVGNVSAAGERPSVAKQAEALAVLQAAGFKIQAPDPNVMKPFGNSTARPPQQTLSGAQQPQPSSALARHSKPIVTSSSGLATGTGAGGKPAAARGPSSDFEKAFGRLDAESSEGQRVVGARPTQAAAERESGRRALEKRLDGLAKKDALSEKMQQATCIEVNAHRCRQCDYLAERQGSECKAAGHQTERLTVKKRGFRCAKCRNHTTAINKRWPLQACGKCGSTEFKDASVVRERNAAPDPANEFLARGEEHGKFRNSAPPASSDARQSGHTTHDRPSASHNPNHWQGTLPTFDD